MQAAIEEMVDEPSKAKCYYSDAFGAYDRLWYHLGSYQVHQTKADAFSVEAGNIELRHFWPIWRASSAVFRVVPKP